MRDAAHTKILSGRPAATEKEGTGMFETKTLRRLAAGVGAFALAAAGLLGVGTAHADDEPSPGNITGTAGDLYVHKHKGDPGAGTAGDGTQLDPLPDPLEGVKFTVQRVGHTSQDPIDLTTSEGWDLAITATPANVGAAPFSLGTGTSVVTGADGVAHFADLAYGLYLVTETDPGDNPIVSPVAPFLVSVPFPSDNTWLYDVHVYPKNKLNETVPTKTVTDPGNQLAVGDDVVWTVTAPVPPLATGDVFDSFIISDDFDDRLAIDTANVVVKLDGVTLVAGTDYAITPAAGSSTAGPEVVITLTGALEDLIGADEVVVTYTTQVKELGESPYFENQAFVNANDTQKSTDTPRVNWGSIEVTKVNKANEQQTLKGAVFEVYDAKDGAKVAGPLTTGDDGKLRVDGLWVGINDDTTQDYWLKEVKAPAGYVTPTGDAAWTKVTVTADGLNAVQVTITNAKQQGPGLPLTGGVGTAIFGGTGLALIVVAVAAGIAVRRRQTVR